MQEGKTLIRNRHRVFIQLKILSLHEVCFLLLYDENLFDTSEERNLELNRFFQLL